MIYISYIEFNNLSKKYKNSKKYAIKDINFTIKKGEFVVIVGPSGSGKSTLLDLICGFEDITEGNIKIDNEIINDIEPKDRDVSMVFQNYALYPHLTAYENIAFGMKIRKVNKNEINEKVMWAAKILHLEDCLKSKPKNLSGGQRQRIALARAMVRNPKVFLMDEPLSNLDVKLRNSTSNEITNLHKELNATTIYVTHDQVEALTMADKIVILNEGEIQQIGTPLDIYTNPSNVFVATFIGRPEMNLFNLSIEEEYISLDNSIRIIKPEELNYLEKGEYILGLRAEDIKNINNIGENIKNKYNLGNSDNVEKNKINKNNITEKNVSYSHKYNKENINKDFIDATIEKIEYLGSETIYHLLYEEIKFTWKAYNINNLKIGEKVHISFNFTKANIFNKLTQENIRSKQNEGKENN
ncbi:ABC transporter ATP-binding protein [Clostridium sp.]|uniref:ABC transporter ATP-binding protein n=1 Tax=Clostridium sp. TaxID=1506 RepID=UPI0025C31266|nr:ABC transporter ATP-binding protein [Clostridium sp.]